MFACLDFGFMVFFLFLLQRLYDLGGRRILVTGTGPLGCVPAELAMSGSTNGECAPEPQRAAQIFNPQLFQMLQNLNRELGSDVFITANAFAMNTDLINSPQRFGLFDAAILIFLIRTSSSLLYRLQACRSAQIYSKTT